MNNAYEKLVESSKELYSLKSAGALLGWDQETMMPPRGGEGRAEALSTVSKLMHKLYTAPELGDAIEACLAAGALTPEQFAVVRELKKDRDKLLKIPGKLAGELARTASLAQQAWVEARPKNDTAGFNPWLEKMLSLRRQEAEHLGYEEKPYDALLDNYEPGARASKLATVFAELKAGLVPLLEEVKNATNAPDDAPLRQEFDVERQKLWNRGLLQAMTFNLEAGRLDVSAHPFTESVWPTDVRLTTRFRADDLPGALFSTLHEGGHGLYEQGFRPEFYGTPMAEAVSLGIHESQSRLWENQIGRSREFWDHHYPSLAKLFPEQLGRTPVEDFWKAINVARPSLIRVEADELTYNLHIIIRFELELALFDKQLEISGLEAAWSDAYERYLGIRPEKPSDGYLQDVHWSAGLMGYFPTYSLGNIYSAQLMAKAESELRGLKEQVGKGQFHPLREWLRVKIHQHGRLFLPEQLIERITGEKPTSRYLLDYLKSKYRALYS